MSDDIQAFEQSRCETIAKMGQSESLNASSRQWFNQACEHQYTYHFNWLGLPIIQFPQDMVAMQELIWDIKPDLIIETGIARGGSLIFYASMLQLLGKGKVIGVDIDIRDHNRKAIESHPMSHRIEMIQGSSIDEATVDQIKVFTEDAQTIMVVLDSNHTHNHVRKELELYAPLTTKGSYLVVFDTVVEHMPAEAFPNRPWGPGDNPMTAVHEYLKTTNRFEIDRSIPDKLQLTVAPDGYLRCVKD